MYEFKSFFKNSVGVLTEHKLRQYLRRFHAAKSKLASTANASSMEKVVKEGVNILSTSSADDGKVMPPKSVKWRASQCKKPSGTPPGGGAGVTPSVLHVPSSSSKYWHLSSMLQLLPM